MHRALGRVPRREMSLRAVLERVRRDGVLGTLKQLSAANEVRRGELRGVDQFGNKYFEKLNPAEDARVSERWVEYNLKSYWDASSVPPEWHSWLHGMTDKVPEEREPVKYAYQKPHQPKVPSNLGVGAQYLPPRYALRAEAVRPPSKYEPWQPQGKSGENAP